MTDQDAHAPARERFLPFGLPSLGEEEIAEVVDTLRSGWIGTGAKCLRFEEEFRQYVGSRHAVSVSSCTAGLHLALVVSGIGPGDEVITSPMTFAATGNVIIHADATPIFADIDPRTLNILPLEIERRITDRTRAVIVVHFGGLPCDMDEIMAIARRHRLVVIEDAAHAVGGRYRGRNVGTLGELASFSFYANKNITTAEGGMVTTDSAAQADCLRAWRLHGLSADAWKRYTSKELILSDVVYPGFKYNMTDLQASLGLWQLRKLERFLAVREEYAALYDRAFAEMEEVALQTRPPSGSGSRHALHLYVLLLDLERLTCSRDEFVSALRRENIGAGIHYTALHLHPYYMKRFKHSRGDFPNAELASDRILSLPLSPAMTPEDVGCVVEVVRRTLRRFRKGRGPR